MCLEPSAGIIPASVASALINNIPDMVLCITKAGHATAANAAAAESLGYNFSNGGVPIERFLSAQTAECLHAILSTEAAQLDDRRSAFPGIALSASRQTLPVEIRALGAHQCDGEGHCLVILMRNLLLPGALYADEALPQPPGVAELSALVAHDVSNPLSVVKLYLEWISSDIDFENDSADSDQSMLNECLRNIQQSAGRIETFISKLRDFSRDVEPKGEIIDLKQTLEDALLIMSGRLASDNIEVKTKMPETKCPICANPHQLRHAFLYILVNACDALADSDQKEICIEIERASDQFAPSDLVYECTVMDSGHGMKPDIRDRAFEAFLSTKKGAPGLGLPIMRNIMRRHGGDVRIESEEGKGTAIHMTLPALLDECGRTSEVIDEP